jgi:hypothetical protein
VLFSHDVDGRTMVSLFAADGVRDWNGDEGWGVRAWAQYVPPELAVHDVDGRTKVSLFAADGVRDWNGDKGWGVRAWGQYVPPELAADVPDDLNIGGREEESGRHVPVTRIQSFQGAEHAVDGPHVPARWAGADG